VFVAYVLTAPEWKRQGVALGLLVATLRALRDAGDEYVDATITEGNVASERLFAAAGFHRYDPAL
jgi:RimJ/RimL family protein N-acetyltransferase